MQGERGRVLRSPSSRPATAAAFAGLFILQLATNAASFAPSATYLPQTWYAFAGPLYIVLLGVGGALILLGLLRVVRAVVRPADRLARFSASFMLTTVCSTLAGAGVFYSRFGNYPTAALWRDFTAAPSAFVAYTLSDASGVDVVLAMAGAGAFLAMSMVVTSLVWRNPASGLVSAAMVGAGVLLIWGTHAFPSKNVNRQHGFLIAEHSLPVAKYLFQWLTARDGDGVESARPFTPYGTSLEAGMAGELIPVRHVLLVIAEAVRADHLMAYGYQRHTMPYVEANLGDWLVFRRAYSHGSRTADSFPVIFNSRYFAAVDHTNAGAAALWLGLRSAGVATGFISAGALEWSGVAQAINFAGIDHRMMASDFSKDQRREVSALPFDYAVDDSKALRKYMDLMATAFRVQPSFVTLHLVGSHYPFHYDGTADEFLPSLRQPTDTSAGGRVLVQNYDSDVEIDQGRLEELRNSYDNSLRHIDRILQQAVESLQRAGIADDSVVIFTADHGESLGEHQTLFHGTTLYDEQVHVPLMMRVGKNVSDVERLLAGRAEHVAGQVDLIPTVYQLLSGNRQLPEPFEGRSWLTDSPKPYELLLFRGIGEKLGLISDDHKFLFDVIGRRGEEYDLSVDPGEQNDLWRADESTSSAFLNEVRKKRVLRFRQ